MRNQVIPGGRIVLIVTMKFSPVKIELKPRIKAPLVARDDRRIRRRAVRRVKRPTRVQPAGAQCGNEKDRAEAPEVEAAQVQSREKRHPWHPA